jgi:DNA replication protein DnaC
MEKIGDVAKRVADQLSRAQTTPPGKSRPACTGSAGTKKVTEEAISQEDRALQAELRAQMARASGLPLETRAAMRLSTLKLRRGVKGLREALEGARAVLRRELAWLTLCGTVGLGKTHIAVAIGWEWLEQGRVCRYAQVSRLLVWLRRTYDFTPEQAFELREPRFETVFGWYLDAPLLILDDLGTEKLTDWAAEKLDTLIDHRYVKGLPLVVTTNVPAAQLSPRIASRLQDRRLGRVVTLSGPDYRIQGEG